MSDPPKYPIVMYRKRTRKDSPDLVERPEIVWTALQERRAIQRGWSHSSDYMDGSIEGYLIAEAKRNRAAKRYMSRLPKQKRWEMMRSHLPEYLQAEVPKDYSEEAFQRLSELRMQPHS